MITGGRGRSKFASEHTFTQKKHANHYTSWTENVTTGWNHHVQSAPPPRKSSVNRLQPAAFLAVYHQNGGLWGGAPGLRLVRRIHSGCSTKTCMWCRSTPMPRVRGAPVRSGPEESTGKLSMYTTWGKTAPAL